MNSTEKKKEEILVWNSKENEDKFWNPELGELDEPEGWDFLPSGDLYLTRTVKKIAVTTQSVPDVSSHYRTYNIGQVRMRLLFILSFLSFRFPILLFFLFSSLLSYVDPDLTSLRYLPLNTMNER